LSGLASCGVLSGVWPETPLDCGWRAGDELEDRASELPHHHLIFGRGLEVRIWGFGTSRQILSTFDSGVAS
jgi:hypothetical protein